MAIKILVLVLNFVSSTNTLTKYFIEKGISSHANNLTECAFKKIEIYKYYMINLFIIIIK